MQDLDEMMRYTIQGLSQDIGGRGSCTQEERKAGEWIAERMRLLGVLDVQMEKFLAVPSTYWPFGLAFGLALTGSISSLLFPGVGATFLAALLNALGFGGMLVETNLKSSWLQRLLPRSGSQNVSGLIPASGEPQGRVVLCAHLDSHRTPIFYSSDKWQKAFSLLIGLTLFSMGLGALGYTLGLALNWGTVRWLGILLVPIQVFALAMCLHADFTPYSPGANDNASGTAVLLAVARMLNKSPLPNLEVHFAFTGCEEVWAYGMRAYLDAHEADLGDKTFYIILDQVGSGRLKFLTSDGLMIKHKTHMRALDIARQVASRLPELEVFSGAGLAYTDALVATQRGLAALTLCAVPANGSYSASTPGANSPSAHWHQMSDTLEHISPEALDNAARYTWAILQELSSSSP